MSESQVDPTTQPIGIVGGGPIGLTLALLLAHRRVATTVFDARSIDETRRDRRLLALARGTLDILAPLVKLPSAALAPIRSVIVSSRGEFGRAVLDADELGTHPLGATIRYGDLIAALDEACATQARIEIRRRCAVESMTQAPDGVTMALAGGATVAAALAINAEGGSARRGDRPVHDVALIADVEIEGIAAGTAIERFTRDGPLALLPLPQAGAGAARPMALVWCMKTGRAEARESLPERAFIDELGRELGQRGARIHGVRARARYPLMEDTRDSLRDHRIVHVGNAAQTLHPVAGQGFNLGVRDCATLAGLIAEAVACGRDPVTALPRYENARRADRMAIGALTRNVPGLFATRFAPVAAARSLGLTLLSIVPNLRADLARLLMFGVRF
jgi:2-octaprenyl-6-methoxyphenol hydroxylase